MDVYIPAGIHASQNEDIFHVIVEVNSNQYSRPSIELSYHLRTSSYGIYDECRDRGRGDLGVEGKLCICSLPHSSTPSRQWHLDPPKVFGKVTAVVSLNELLFIYERRAKHGIVLEASCDIYENTKHAFEVVVFVKHKKNVVSSKDFPLKIVIKSGMMLFLDVFYQLDVSKIWDLEYEVSYMQIE